MISIKSYLYRAGLVAVTVVLVLVSTIPAQAAGNGPAGANRGAGLLPVSGGELSPEETAALLFMREEEKLARDVYIVLYEAWGLPVFQTISQSEQAHMNAMKVLLDRYGLQDPASLEPGVFSNSELQALYTGLVERGLASMGEALQVGSAIEEIDILDLEERIAQTDQADILRVFNNLLRGSQNHLRAFAASLSIQTGETYQPQYLDPETYETLISQSPGRGTGRQGNQGNRARASRP